MATPGSGGVVALHASTIVLPTVGGSVIVPDAHLLFAGAFKRAGADLVIELDGKKALIPHYFSSEHAPTLMSSDGAVLSGETARALAGADNPWVLAQASGGTAGPIEIGTVKVLQGNATAQRGGTSYPLAVGQPIYQGDIIETGGQSQLGITLTDRTVFSLSANARMVMSQHVYDPARTDNSTAVSFVQGTFVFITGLVAKSGTLSVTTPVATMGIRGTTPIVKLSAVDGSGTFTLGNDPPGGHGSYVLKSLLTGEDIATVDSTDIVVRIQSASGPFQIGLKTADDTTLDLQLLVPAYQLFQLLSQRADLGTGDSATGKGQSQEVIKVNFALGPTLGGPNSEGQSTPLLADTKFTVTTDSSAGDTTTGFEPSSGTQPRGPLLIDLDTLAPGRNHGILYPENSGPVQVADHVQISLPTSATQIASATIVLQNALPGDNLLVGTLPAGITFTITLGSIHVNLTGVASAADYTAAIESIRFINTSDNPSTDLRIIEVTVTTTDGLSTTSDTLIAIEPINDAPAIHLPAAQTLAEDGIITFSGEAHNAITITDPDAGSGTITATVTVEHGTLTLVHEPSLVVSGDGSATLTLTGTLDAINAALDGLTYRPDADFNGKDHLSVTTNDNGNTGEGGAQVGTSGPGLELTVTAVNDAPVVHLPDPQTLEEDSSIAFSSASENAITITDIDAGSGAITATVTVEHGTLTLVHEPSLVVSGDGSATLTLTGTLDAINAALDGLTYRPDADFNGKDHLSVTTNDNGNTGEGGAQIETSALELTVTAVNDAPVITGLKDSALPTSGLALDGLGGSGWTPHTAVETSPGLYQLTEQYGPGETGAVWGAVDLSQKVTWTARVELSSWNYSGGADGITFTLQSQGPNAIAALAAAGHQNAGGSLGVGGTQGTVGLPGAYGIWIDTYDNGGPPVVAVEPTNPWDRGNSISFFANDANGALILPDGAVPIGLPFPLESGHFLDLTVTWNPLTSTLSYTLTDPLSGGGEPYSVSQSITIDPSSLPPGQVYYGFTGSTGALTNDQSVEIVDVTSLPVIDIDDPSIKGLELTISDVDAGDDRLTAHISVADGAIVATVGDSGVTIVGESNGTSELVVNGTLAELNAFLHGNSEGASTIILDFSDYDGYVPETTTITVTVNDNGHTGAGGPQSTTFTTTVALDYSGSYEGLALASLAPDGSGDATPAASSAFIGLGSAVDLVDFARDPTLASVDTVGFLADAPLKNPDYAIDVINAYDSDNHRIDLSALLDAAGISVDGGTIGEHVKATEQADGSVLISTDVTGPPGSASSPASADLVVARITNGTAGADHHALGVGDTIAVVFDQHQPTAHVTIGAPTAMG